MEGGEVVNRDSRWTALDELEVCLAGGLSEVGNGSDTLGVE